MSEAGPKQAPTFGDGADAFEIIETVSTGGMGKVYKARQVRLNRVVALKVLREDRALDRMFCRRFQEEAKAAAAIDHPGVVRLWTSGSWRGLPWIAYEWVEGESLAASLKREGSLPAPDACRLIANISNAVHAAHLSRVIHRDLKPENILIAGSGKPKVTDFGFARYDAGADITKSGDVFGTTAYMAPEQVAGERRRHGPVTDVWALGVLLYRCLCGRLPFDKPNFVATLQSILDDPAPPSFAGPSDRPWTFDRLFGCLLHKEPERRLARADVLARTLQLIAVDLEAPTRRDPLAALLASVEARSANVRLRD